MGTSVPDVYDLVLELNTACVGYTIVGEQSQVGQDASATETAAVQDALGSDPVGPDDPNATVDLVDRKQIAQFEF